MTKHRLKILYPLRVLKYLLKLPKYIEFFEIQNQQRQSEVTSTLESQKTTSDSLRSLRGDIEDINRNISILPSVDARLVSLQERFSKLQRTDISFAKDSIITNNTVADNHDFDYFYKLFEDRFRGSEEIIKDRVSEHIQHFTGLPDKLKKLPVIDIGCGRGEFLSLLKDNQIHGIGVDMNRSMVDRAKKLGFEAEENDALTYLSDKKTSSLSAITGFHIVEHIPFEVLMKIFEECYRTVAPGGFALFETPNPETLSVGANTFYLDPSHQRPIPPPLLSFMLESVGFKPEIITLHRVKPALVDPANDTIKEMYDSLYGPGDYAVIGRKII